MIVNLKNIENSLYHYTKFPSKQLTDPNDINFDMINDPADCAKKCDSEVKIQCRSFNYCPDLKKCYLSKNHIADSLENTNPDSNLACDHYSRDFLSDFTLTSATNITTSAELVYEGTNLEECAQLCVSTDGFDCKSLDFCPDSKKCLLNSGPKNKPSSNSNKELCYNYKSNH